MDQPAKRQRWRLRYGLSGLLLVMLLACFASLWLRNYLASRPVPWVNYSAASLSRYQSDQRIVLVSFQADWDITSVLNQRTIEQPGVSRWLRRYNAVAMHADCTRQSPEVSAAMKQLGQASVPLVVIYHPNRPQTPTIINGVVSDEELLKILADSEK